MLNLRLKEKRLLVGDIWQFFFERPRDFSWQAGQHVVLVLEHPNPDERGIDRALSIASALPGLMTLSLVKSMPAMWQAYWNIARGWPPPKRMTSDPSSFLQSKSGSGARPVMKNPSISLICAK